MATAFPEFPKYEVIGPSPVLFTGFGSGRQPGGDGASPEYGNGSAAPQPGFDSHELLEFLRRYSAGHAADAAAGSAASSRFESRMKCGDYEFSHCTSTDAELLLRLAALYNDLKRLEQQATKAPSLDWTTMLASPAIAQLACIQHVYDTYCWHHLRRDLPDVRDGIGYIEAVFRAVPDAEVQAHYRADGLYFTRAGGRGLEGFRDAAGAIGAREQFLTPTYDETKAIVAFAGTFSAFRAGAGVRGVLRASANDLADEATGGILGAARSLRTAPNRIATLESKLATRTMTRAEWTELSQLRRIEANGLQQVSRWGRPGLQPDDWVQLGGPTRLNYILTGKWQPGFGNKFAPFRSGETYFLPPEQIVWPSGWGLDGWWKGLFNQRIFVGAGL